MTAVIPTPPEHPFLGEARVSELAQHLERELQLEPAATWTRLRARRRSILALAMLAIFTLVGTGYAVGNDVFDVFDHWASPTDPKRIGDRFEVATGEGWALQAWTSTRGICLGVVLDGDPAGSGCGMPVVGAPPDSVFQQPPPTHLIGYMAGGADGYPLYVTGPIAENVARVEIQLIDGRLLEAAVYEAPTDFKTAVDFYFLLDTQSANTTFERHPVKTLRAYDTQGVLLEELVIPVPRLRP